MMDLCVCVLFRCAFLPNSGAFFIGYILISALIGTSIKLLRVPELLLYIFRRLQAKTTLQKELSLKKVCILTFHSIEPKRL